MSHHLVVISDRVGSLPKRFWVARATSCVAGAALQLLGLYAAIVTFGLWPTLGAYAIGGLAVVVQQVVLARSAS